MNRHLIFIVSCFFTSVLSGQVGLCGVGTFYEVETGECLPINDMDSDGNGLYTIVDLCEFLTHFGTEVAPAPCACNHGGECDENGVCDCPPGFGGEFCEEIIPPSSVWISEIRLFNTWSGSCFDSFLASCPPDLFVRVEYNSTAFNASGDGLVYESGYYTDPGAVWLTFGADFQMNLAFPSFELEVWDFDELQDEYVGRLTFNPDARYSPSEGDYPATWSIVTTNFNVEFDVEYFWD